MISPDLMQASLAYLSRWAPARASSARSGASCEWHVSGAIATRRRGGIAGGGGHRRSREKRARRIGRAASGLEARCELYVARTHVLMDHEPMDHEPCHEPRWPSPSFRRGNPTSGKRTSGEGRRTHLTRVAAERVEGGERQGGMRGEMHVPAVGRAEAQKCGLARQQDLRDGRLRSGG